MSRAITVEEFRRASGPRKIRHPITRQEWIILGAAAPAVIISPFLLGGMVWWSQVTIASLQALVFLVALSPVTGLADWRTRVGKLLRFPPFWLGALFVLYVIIQALNPSWEQIYVDETKFYVAERKPEYFIAWLPQSMNTNFYVMNAWRMVIFWAGAWAFVCGLWMGLNTRRAWFALAWLTLGVGAVVSLASIAHHISANENLFWIEKYKRTEGAFGPFVYRNQAAAYLYLSMGLGLTMFLHLLKRGHLRSGLPWVALALSMACLLGVALCPSRGGWLGTGGILAVFLLLLPFAISWQEGFSIGAVVSSAVILLAFGCVGWWVATTMDFSQIKEKWKDMASGDNVSVGARLQLNEITWDMFQEKPWTGWGAGSYYYQFPYYAMAYPKLYFAGKPTWKRYGEFRINFKQAHNDHFQFLAEYGVIGFALLVMCGAYWFFAPLIPWSIGLEWCMVAGVSLVFILHNFGDFFLQNSITLQAWLILLAPAVGAAKSRQGGTGRESGSLAESGRKTDGDHRTP